MTTTKAHGHGFDPFDGRDLFFLVKAGRVQFTEQKEGIFFLIFVNEYEARRAAKGASVARAGSVEGETILAQIRAASALGATPAIVKDGLLYPLQKR